MQIGSLLKYHRTKKGLTQSQLAMGVCSVPHLSKIENNSKEANVETIRLLLSRLDVDVQDVEASERTIKSLLKELLQHIQYLEAENAERTMNELGKHKEVVAFSKYIYLYELYKLRYCLFIKDLKGAELQIKWLQAQKQNFSQHERYLLSYFSAIALLMKGRYGEADEKLSAIVLENPDANAFEGEICYHLALVKGQVKQHEHAIYYGKKAIVFLQDQFNYKRILHVQMILAINYSQSKIYEEAMITYEHLIRNSGLLQQNDLLPQIYHNMGDLRHKMGDYAIALEYFKKSSLIIQKNTENYLLCLYNIAITEFRLEKWSESKESFTLLHEEAVEMKVSQYQLYSSFYLLLLNDKKQKAMSFLEDKVVPYTRKVDEQKEFHHHFSKILTDYYVNEGNYEKAVKYKF